MSPPSDQEGPRRGRFATSAGVSPFHRLLFAVAGLIAGNAALLIYLLYGALRSRGALLAARIGDPNSAFSAAGQIFVIYAVFSILGSFLVGIPIALAFPARVLSRTAWPLRLLIGASLGPLALLLIFIVIDAIQGSLGAFSLANTESLWPFSILVSTVAFLVYAALLRGRLMS